MLSAGYVSAFTEPIYPIGELGNCKDKNDCMNFCNDSANMSACISYGENNGLITSEEAKLSKKVVEKIKKGEMPGNCKTKEQCSNYCQGNVKNLEECLSLADDIGFSDNNINEGKKILKALKEGAQMPGDCKTKDECENYCSDVKNIDQCLNFAEKAQLMSSADLAEAKKVIPFLKSGETPGGCKTKETCNSYCAEASHYEQCITFAEKAGFISSDEAKMARVSGGSGPGGCKSSEECQKYCQDPSHLDECIKTGVKAGMIKEEDVQKIMEGGKAIKDGLAKIPEGARTFAESCLNEVFGGKLESVLSGIVQITKEQGDKIESCFTEAINDFIKSQMPSSSGSSGGVPSNIPSGMPSNIPSNIPNQGAMPGGLQGPPCSSPEECARMFGPQM